MLKRHSLPQSYLTKPSRGARYAKASAIGALKSAELVGALPTTNAGAMLTQCMQALFGLAGIANVLFAIGHAVQI